MNEDFSSFPNPNDNVDTNNNTKRETNRDSLFLTANLRFQDGGEEGAVRVRNLSIGGLMAEALIQATRGSKIEIELKNIGWITGKVAWVADKKIGIAFDHPIDPKIVRSPTIIKERNLPHYLKKLDRIGDEIKYRKY